MKPASSEARKATRLAISSGAAYRPSVVFSTYSSRIAGNIVIALGQPGAHEAGRRRR